MRVIVEQTGGFVGYLRHEVDTRELDPEQRDTLIQLLRSCERNRTSARQMPPPGNTASSRIIIESEEGTSTINIGAGNKTRETASLMKFVQRAGKPKPL